MSLRSLNSSVGKETRLWSVQLRIRVSFPVSVDFTLFHTDAHLVSMKFPFPFTKRPGCEIYPHHLASRFRMNGAVFLLLHTFLWYGA
jgi:hypothetical protein